MRPAAFLDRDGVLNHDTGYVYRIEDFRWVEGAKAALQRLQEAGFALVIVTNQSGIGRGKYSEADYQVLCRWMVKDLADAGVHLDGIYHCPHTPPEPGKPDCDCRKPWPGMLLRAQAELQLDLARSWMFGDKPQDIEAGRAAGVARCIRIRSRYAPDTAAAPNACFDSLLQACAHELPPLAAGGPHAGDPDAVRPPHLPIDA